MILFFLDGIMGLCRSQAWRKLYTPHKAAKLQRDSYKWAEATRSRWKCLQIRWGLLIVDGRTHFHQELSMLWMFMMLKFCQVLSESVYRMVLELSRCVLARSDRVYQGRQTKYCMGFYYCMLANPGSRTSRGSPDTVIELSCFKGFPS